MPNRRAPKKSAVREDWHPAIVVARLRMAGWSLRSLSVRHGLTHSTLQKANSQPYPHAERIIARAIGVKPQDIWPSRYDANGRALHRRRGPKPKTQSTHNGAARNVCRAGAE